jgi:2-dehydro-3-deoxyphosphogluconate aldolase/(4S)-4-hydroxy-2-oxoglutarate aldolase
MADIQNRLRQIKIVPVIVIDDPGDAIPLAGALIDGGLPCAEITFRTAAGVESLRRIAVEFPDMLVGAGTVLSPQQAAQPVIPPDVYCWWARPPHRRER